MREDAARVVAPIGVRCSIDTFPTDIKRPRIVGAVMPAVSGVDAVLQELHFSSTQPEATGGGFRVPHLIGVQQVGIGGSFLELQQSGVIALIALVVRLRRKHA